MFSIKEKNKKITKRIFYSICKFPYTIFAASKSKILSTEETVYWSKKYNKSIIRLGDGELMILRGKDIYYQESSPQLQAEMKRIISDYNKKSNYLLCVVPFALNHSILFYLLKKERFNKTFLIFYSYRFYFKKCMDKKELQYGDAFTFAKENEDIYKYLWLNKKHIIFVHNNEKFANQFKEKYHKNVYFIKVPEKNAYSEYKRIENEIVDCINSINDKNNTIVLLSCGPCSKVIIYNLIEKTNVQFIDTGHCWDDPLNQEVCI